ncbi:transmembrane protein 120 homolog [Tigriopus californicus]|uniref:transmembrane protein 120 homolog n=1 Tax=Tigriopus californicus TaxID=6832 RepID=UPI0027DA0681|nr:transmembrane protein 120 homolog [Tigriopus californicus]
MDNTELAQSLKDWAELSQEYAGLQDLHKKYLIKLQEALALQRKCVAGVNHQRYRLKATDKLLKHVRATNDEENAEKSDLDKDILRRKAQLSQMEDSLPRPSGRYLNIILGGINVSILDKKAKYDYKDQYERFKLIVNLVGCVLACISLYFNMRVFDLMFMFLTVWYYCTLTIRESILKVNGSRIKGWWRLHHFISTFAGGVLLIWPDGEVYLSFRNQLMWFNVYLAFLQYLQFAYQRGVLYRLRSLGERNDMDITIDGFHSWMWKGLGFLLPFLYAGYIFQLYNAYVLFHLTYHPQYTWQVPCLCLVFTVLGLGNIITTSLTIPLKISEHRKGLLKLRFTRLDKYFWTHRKRRDSEAVNNKKYLEDVERILRPATDTLVESSSSSSMDEDTSENIKDIPGPKKNN